MSNDRSRTRQCLRLVITVLVGFAATGGARAAPMITLTPDPLQIEVRAGGDSFAPYNLQNTGTVPVVVTDMQITGPDAQRFHFVDAVCGNGQACTPNFRIAPGASRSFYAGCAPPHVGFFTSTLTVKSSAGTSTLALVCAGDAPASMSTLAFSPASIDFGISYAEPPFPELLVRTLTVTNTAPPPAEPVEFAFEAPLPSNGSFVAPGPGFLGPGESQQFQIGFTWFGGVRSTAPLVLRSPDPSQPVIRVPMFAEAAYGHLAFDAPAIANGQIILPAVAAGDTATITIRGHNDGDFELNFSDSSAFADFGGVAELQGPTGFASLAPGASIQWTLTCTPDGSEGAEPGASGTVVFNYFTAASDFDTFSLFCPILNAPPPAPPASTAPAVARAELPQARDPSEPGGCSAAAPSSLAPLGGLALGWLVPRRRIRRRAGGQRR